MFRFWPGYRQRVQRSEERAAGAADPRAEAATARQRAEVGVLLDRFGSPRIKPKDIFGAASNVVLSAVLLASGAALVQLKFAASLC